MLEITLVIAALAAVGAASFVAFTFTPHLMAGIGLSALILGLLVGVPTGFWYHVVLYRVLSPRGSLPTNWWLAPSSLHHHLTVTERQRLWPWYRLGGVGFVLSVAGGVAAIVGVLLAR